MRTYTNAASIQAFINSSEEEYGFPSFRFETLPDSLLHRSQHGVYSFRKSVRNNMMLDKFLDLLTKLNDSSSRNGSQPAVSCIISDGFMPFTIEAAQQLGLSVVMFLTISACSFMGYKQFRTLKEKGLVPLKGKRLKRFIFNSEIYPLI